MEAKQIASDFKVLADETRMKIILALKGKILCACELLKTLNITQPTLSYHMNMLTRKNWVSFEKKGIWVYYMLNEQKFDDLFQFLLPQKTAI